MNNQAQLVKTLVVSTCISKALASFTLLYPYFDVSQTLLFPPEGLKHGHALWHGAFRESSRDSIPGGFQGCHPGLMFLRLLVAQLVTAAASDTLAELAVWIGGLEVVV